MCSFSLGMNKICITFVRSMKKLYLFNPENDMALASGSAYYMAPASAKKMAADLATLPMWYAEDESDVWVSDKRQVEWMNTKFPSLLSVRGVTDISTGYKKISAWAWSPALLHRLETYGVASGAPSFCERMEIVRALSGRKTAVDLLPKLRVESTLGESFWLTSVEDVSRFSSLYNKVLLKAPWSGSGKGLQPLSGCPDDNLKGWARRIIASQGGLVGEPFYDKVVDFAMEFLSGSDDVSFVGYSLFEADSRGIYKENRLASDEAIEGYLTRFVSLEVLEEIRDLLLQELRALAGGDYQGYLGVDMMICRMNGEYLVHPCVEVNWRMNMGVVSRLFYDRFISEDSQGRYVIEYYPRGEEAKVFHERMKQSHPLVMEEGRIKEGYLSLTPVFEDTSYQIYVLIEKKDAKAF